MPMLITESAAPLLMETVPVLKIRHFYGKPARDTVYAYVRMFVCAGALHVCMTGFDGAPPPATRLALALQSADCLDRYLLLCAGPAAGALALAVCDARSGRALQTLQTAALPVVRTQGDDEQGWYWSVQTIVPSAVFTDTFGAKARLRTGVVYAGNAFLYGDEEAFGAAFPVPAGQRAPACAGFDTLTVVPY